jgi:hypothetical protein
VGELVKQKDIEIKVLRKRLNLPKAQHVQTRIEGHMRKNINSIIIWLKIKKAITRLQEENERLQEENETLKNQQD